MQQKNNNHSAKKTADKYASGVKSQKSKYLKTILKRSKVRNTNNLFYRGLVPKFFISWLIALFTVALMAGLAFGQGNFTQSGVGAVTNTGTLVIKGTAAFGAQTTVGGTVDYAKAGPSQSIADVDYNNLTLSGGAGSLKAFPNADVAIAGNLTLSGGVVKADVNARPGTSAVINYNGGTQAVAAIDYQGLTFSAAGTKTFAAGVTKIAGSFTLTAGTADATANATTLEFDGTGAQTLAAINYDNLSITGTRAATPAITLASGIIGIKSAFTVSPINPVTYVTTGNAVNYNGTLAQTITAFNYNDLTTSATRGTNNITLASSGTIGVFGAFNPTATFAGGGYVVTGSTINYNGLTGQSIIGGATFPLYENLTISGSGTKAASGAIALNAAGVLNNSVTFNMGTSSLTFTAAPSNSGTVQFAGLDNGRAVGSAAGIVEYNGAIAQNVLAGTYFHLMFTNGSALAQKTIAGAVTAANNLTVNATGFLTVSGTGAVQINNDLINTGAITNAGTVTVGL